MKPDPIALLRKLEWFSGLGHERRCPTCHRSERNAKQLRGHAAGCEMDACLALPQSEEPAVPASADRVRSAADAIMAVAADRNPTDDPEPPSDLPYEDFARAALSATPEQGRVEERNPDYVYDKNAWEWTSNWEDRDTLTEGRYVGEIIHVGTLYSGPDKWAARIDETEVLWFDTREEAEAALAPRATTDHDGGVDV